MGSSGRDPRRVLAALAVATACAGASTLAGCNSVDDRPAQWDYISPVIFQPSCATPSCHSRAVAVAGLDFSDADRGYRSLTALTVWQVTADASAGDGGCEQLGSQVICPTAPRGMVVAFDPDQSRLVNMLRARGAPRMPPDRPLPEKDIELVERWILDGARRTPSSPAADNEGAPPSTGPADGSTVSDGGGN
jgi:hypothetical protein